MITREDARRALVEALLDDDVAIHHLTDRDILELILYEVLDSRPRPPGPK